MEYNYLQNSNPNPWISLYEYQPLGIKTKPRACCTAASTLVIRDIFQRTRFVVWQRFLSREYV